MICEHLFIVVPPRSFLPLPWLKWCMLVIFISYFFSPLAFNAKVFSPFWTPLWLVPFSVPDFSLTSRCHTDYERRINQRPFFPSICFPNSFPLPFLLRPSSAFLHLPRCYFLALAVWLGSLVVTAAVPPTSSHWFFGCDVLLLVPQAERFFFAPKHFQFAAPPLPPPPPRSLFRFYRVFLSLDWRFLCPTLLFFFFFSPPPFFFFGGGLLSIPFGPAVFFLCLSLLI